MADETPPRHRRSFEWTGRRTDVAGDVDRELSNHIELAIEELVERGMEREDARAEVMRRFGNVDRTRAEIERLDRERLAESRRSERWRDVVRDARYSARALVRQPGFTLVVLLTLALGIGGNAAIFSVLNGVLLRPLPYPAPERLVTIWTDNRLQDWPRDVSAYPNFADWREQSTSFDAMAAYTSGGSLTLTGDGEPEAIVITQGTPSLFDVLQVPAALGRTLIEEDMDREQRAIVLAHGFWQRRFGGDPAIVGSTLRLNGNPYEVVGVMPEGFAYPQRTVDGYISFSRAVTESNRNQFWLEVIGRRKATVSEDALRAELAGIAQRLEREYEENRGLGITVVPLHEYVVGDVRRALLVLMAATIFVLLIACANVANLVMVRAAGRGRELAVRAALGAGRRRLAAQLSVESLWLALAGGALGLLIAVGGVRVLTRLAPADLPRVDAIRVDGAVLVFTLVLSLATALFVALPYAWQGTRGDLARSLRDGQRGSGTAGHRVRRALVVSQLALAMLLLVSAGLLLASFRQLQAADAGFDPRGVLTASISLPGARYETVEARRAFHERLEERVAALPGVTALGMTTLLPLTGSDAGGTITVEGREPNPALDDREVRFTTASPGYFSAMRIPLRRGREFQREELGDDSVGVAMINETMARMHFAGRDPIGVRVRLGRSGQGRWYTIVGVVADMRQTALDGPVRPEMFRSSRQFPSPSMRLVVRGAGDASTLAGPLRRTVAELDPDLAVTRIRPLEELWSESLATRRFNAVLLGAFAALALTLSVIGIYGVMAYVIAGRQREVGIRMAIGAQPKQVVRLVVRDAMLMTAIGLALGVLLTVAGTRLLASMLWEVSALDPRLIAATAMVLGATALLAGYIPARRAARVDPLLALRAD